MALYVPSPPNFVSKVRGPGVESSANLRLCFVHFLEGRDNYCFNLHSLSSGV